MLLKDDENIKKHENILLETTKLKYLTTHNSKKFGSHFSIASTSATTPFQKSNLKKTFTSSTTAILAPTAAGGRQKKVLRLTPAVAATPIQKKRVSNASVLDSPIGEFTINASLTSKLSKVTIYSKENNGTAKGVCICDRARSIVICQRCGNELYGRVQLTCVAHPKRICLMDQRECVNSFCRSIHLSEVAIQH